MCVAAVIFKPVSLEHLKAMESDNPHGAGVAWETPEGIRFLKGLTAQEIYDMQTEGAMTYPYLMHYRWATHGEKVPELTHPFPVGPRALMGEISGVADKVLIHNGTWNNHWEAATKFVNGGHFSMPEELIAVASDTAVAAWLAFYNDEVLDSVPWATATAEMRETVDEDGKPTRTMDITTRGTWYDKDGNMYSNLNWVPWQGYGGYSWPEYKGTGYGEQDIGGEYQFWESPCSAAEQRQAGELRAWYRRNDKGFIGHDSDIKVNPQFYESWYPEKDNLKPKLTEWEDWYDRFDWANMGPDISGPETAEKVVDSKGMTWDEYQAKYGASHNEGFTPKVDPQRGDFQDYLVSKYGPSVADEINRCFGSNEVDEVGEGDTETDPALKGWDREIKDPDWLTDGDLITDNPSQVNAWLAKQMEEGDK